ncbi:MAG: response regulator [Armatimonadetes bacterium]|nr:response regulator [Armatimonadota bacterium]
MPYPTEARRRRGNGAKVLIVDDNAAVRGCLEAMFAALGYQSELAKDGREALPKLQSNDYEAVICDLYMPHMDGDQLYQACRSLRGELARRFIFITGEEMETLPAQCLLRDDQPQLLKPFRLADIQQALIRVTASS